MPTALTPQPASSSFNYADASDTVTNQFDQLAPATSTSSVSLNVVSASLAVVASTILEKTVYSNAGVVLTTVNISNLAGTQVTISRVVFSTPIVVKSFSQSFQVVPSNTTVFNTFGSPSSLLLTAGANDLVAQTVAVVSDSTI